MFQSTFVKQHFLGRVQELSGWQRVGDIYGISLSFPYCLFSQRPGWYACLTCTESSIQLGGSLVHCVLFLAIRPRIHFQTSLCLSTSDLRALGPSRPCWDLLRRQTLPVVPGPALPTPASALQAALPPVHTLLPPGTRLPALLSWFFPDHPSVSPRRQLLGQLCLTACLIPGTCSEHHVLHRCSSPYLWQPYMSSCDCLINDVSLTRLENPGVKKTDPQHPAPCPARGRRSA